MIHLMVDVLKFFNIKDETSKKKNQKASEFNVPLSSFNRFLRSLCYKKTDRSNHMNKCNVASSTLGFEYIKNLYYLSNNQEIYWIKSSNTCDNLQAWWTNSY